MVSSGEVLDGDMVEVRIFTGVGYRADFNDPSQWAKDRASQRSFRYFWDIIHFHLLEQAHEVLDNRISLRQGREMLARCPPPAGTTSRRPHCPHPAQPPQDPAATAPSHRATVHPARSGTSTPARLHHEPPRTGPTTPHPRTRRSTAHHSAPPTTDHRPHPEAPAPPSAGTHPATQQTPAEPHATGPARPPPTSQGALAPGAALKDHPGPPAVTACAAAPVSRPHPWYAQDHHTHGFSSAT